MPEPVDVLIITALKSELDALLAIKDPGAAWAPATDSAGYRFYTRDVARTTGGSFRAAAARAVDMGETAAAAAIMRLVYDLRPRHLAMCGICAGPRGEVELGDVVVAERIFKFDGGSAKRATDANGASGVSVQISHDLRTYNLRPLWRQQAEDMDDTWTATLPARPPSLDEQDRWLMAQLNTVPTIVGDRAAILKHIGPDRRIFCPKWPDVIDRLRKRDFVTARGLRLTTQGQVEVEEEQLKYPDGRPAIKPRVHVGAVGTSARVQRDPKLFEELRGIVRKTVAIEMEGAAIGAVAEMLSLPSIMVKSVVDFADLDKDDQFHAYGTIAAAQFLIEFLRFHLPAAQAAPPESVTLGPIGAPPIGVTTRERRKVNEAEKLPGDYQWLLLRSSATSPEGQSDLQSLLASRFEDPNLLITPDPLEPMLALVNSTASTFQKVRSLLQRRALPAPLGRMIRYVARNQGKDEGDTNEGNFGRSPYRNGCLLWASVRTISSGWYEVEIEVRSSDDALAGPVSFHLHETFADSVLRATPREGRASVSIECYGSFVVGAVLADGTRLELDLAGIPGVPRGFIDE